MTVAASHAQARSARRPIMRYFGGKWQLAPWIVSHFPTHKVYVEPYGGAASVFMHKTPSKVEVYNDLDQDVVNVFRVLRDPLRWPELLRRMRCMPYARREFDATLTPTPDKIERALKTLARSRMGFGVNAIRDLTTSMRVRRDEKSSPAHEWAALWNDVGPWAERFAGVTVECDEATAVLQRYDHRHALHYVDPPYVHATRGKRNRYAFEMSDADHRRLADVLHGLKGMVVLSGYDCPLYRELFGSWRRIDRAHLADGARKRVESLWLSPAADKALHPRLIA